MTAMIDTTLDVLATLTQRSAEAEAAWRAHSATAKRWHDAERALWDAIEAWARAKENIR